MPFVHGKSTAFSLDNASNALQNISTYLTDVGFPRTVETGETTTFGVASGAKTYIVGLQDATISLSGNWDVTLDAQVNGVIAAHMSGTLATASWEYGPAGSTASSVKYTGEAVVTSYEQSNPVGDVVTFSLELQVTGAVTRTTY